MTSAPWLKNWLEDRAPLTWAVVFPWLTGQALETESLLSFFQPLKKGFFSFCCAAKDAATLGPDSEGPHPEGEFVQNPPKKKKVVYSLPDSCC